MKTLQTLNTYNNLTGDSMNKIYVIKANIEEIDTARDISKFTTNEFKARQLAGQLQEAARLLGLADIFTCEVVQEDVEE
jgi:hypothetical protein